MTRSMELQIKIKIYKKKRLLINKCCWNLYYRTFTHVEIPGLPTSETSGQCERIDEEDAKHIVPNMDVTYSPREEEDK